MRRWNSSSVSARADVLETARLIREDEQSSSSARGRPCKLYYLLRLLSTLSVLYCGTIREAVFFHFSLLHLKIQPLWDSLMGMEKNLNLSASQNRPNVCFPKVCSPLPNTNMLLDVEFQCKIQHWWQACKKGHLLCFQTAVNKIFPKFIGVVSTRTALGGQDSVLCAENEWLSKRLTCFQSVQKAIEAQLITDPSKPSGQQNSCVLCAVEIIVWRQWTEELSTCCWGAPRGFPTAGFWPWPAVINCLGATWSSRHLGRKCTVILREWMQG